MITSAPFPEETVLAILLLRANYLQWMQEENAEMGREEDARKAEGR